MGKPTFFWDAACGFCRRWVVRWRARTGESVRFMPSRLVARRSSVWVGGGRVARSSDAAFQLFRRAPGLRLVGTLGLLPGIRWVSRRVYRLVARHRGLAARVDRWLLGNRQAVPGTTLVRWIFLRCLGLIFLGAFLSLRAQAKGLYGKDGLEPLAPALQRTRERYGPSVIRRIPSLLWFGASDERMDRLLAAGELASTSLILNIAPRWSIAAAWSIYLSFVNVGGDFLSFQWDSLLLETGAAAFLAAPSGALPGIGRGRPSAAATWLLRWLAFRLHFESGMAKVKSGDLTWRRGTACAVYYETAPLPTVTGWRVHHLPRWFQRFSTGATLWLECVVPWLGLMTRRPRRWAFAKLTFLQTLITATGNYGFFNLLAFADLLWFLDDEDVWPGWARAQKPTFESIPNRVLAAIGGGALFFLSAQTLRARLFKPELGERTSRALQRAAPFMLVNQYGLFSVMTTRRPEIIVEGSADGLSWQPYEFRFKPGDPRRPPRLIVPHMPRLDWLMWFAAFSRPPRWFYSFLHRLLEGSPSVLQLLARNPFPDRPPLFVRASLYDYRMTDAETQRREHVWWRRERLGTYFPPIGRQGVERQAFV